MTSFILTEFLAKKLFYFVPFSFFKIISNHIYIFAWHLLFSQFIKELLCFTYNFSFFFVTIIKFLCEILSCFFFHELLQKCKNLSFLLSLLNLIYYTIELIIFLLLFHYLKKLLFSFLEQIDWWDLHHDRWIFLYYKLSPLSI